MAYEPRDTSNTETTSEETTKTVGIVAVVAVVVLAIAGYFFFADKSGAPVSSSAETSIMSGPSNAASSAYGSAKDAAAEVPQALKDATTKGDQNTTRPNADNSTGSLDQKPAK